MYPTVMSPNFPKGKLNHYSSPCKGLVGGLSCFNIWLVYQTFQSIKLLIEIWSGIHLDYSA